MKCSSCNGTSVYYRANEGRYYCKNHFNKSIEKKFKKTISQNKLVEKNDKIAVALSGGKDSSNTLFLLKKIFGKNRRIKIFAITIDEGIEGYRDKTIEFARRLCEQLGVEHYIFSFKNEFKMTMDEIAKKVPFQYCSFCGVLRRYLINKKARELGATKLATGHNLDDEAQSIIINMLKGDFMRMVRMGAKPKIMEHKNFIPRIKPLVEIPENESELYSLFNNIQFSKLKCPYSTDNPLRQETEEFLNKLEEKSPGIKFGLVRNAYKLMPGMIKKISGNIGSCEKCGEPTSKRICRACMLLGFISHS